MPRVIDADAFLAGEIKRCHCVPSVGSGDRTASLRHVSIPSAPSAGMHYESLKLLLQQEPTIDAVRVVRCKDCRYWQDNNGGYPNKECRWKEDETPDADDFCSCGERKGGDA